MKEDFSQEHVPTSNWFKFIDVGDFIKGTYVSQFFKEGENNMPDQQVFELVNVETKDGKQEGSYRVPIKIANTFVISRVKGVKVGQRVGFKFTELFKSTKGLNDAKSLTPYLWGMDDAYKVAEDFNGVVVTDQNPF